MPPRSSAWRRRWGSDLTREPLDVYAEKENQRAAQIVQKASTAKYGTDAPPAPAARVRQALSGPGGSIEAAMRAAGLPIVPGQTGTYSLTKVQPLQTQKKKGGGFLDRAVGVIDAVTPDALEGPAKRIGLGALTALDAPRKYVGAPAAGLFEDRINVAADLAKGDIGALRPDRLYRRGQREYEENLEARRQIPGVGRALAFAQEMAADPLTYVGPGAVKGALRAAPAAVRASKGARFLGHILENPAGASVGATAAGAVGSQIGYEVGGEKGAAVGGLAGAFAGGVVGGNPRAAARGFERVSDRITGALDRAGVVPRGAVPGGAMINVVEDKITDPYLDALQRHGIEFSFDEDGTIVVDPDEAERVVNDLYAKHMDTLVARREKGLQPGDTSGWVYEGDGYERNSVTGQVRRVASKSSNPGAKSRAERAAEKEAERTTYANHDPELAQDMEDADRIMEILDDYRHDTESLETRRLQWEGDMEAGPSQIKPPKPAKKGAELGPVQQEKVRGYQAADDFARTKMGPGYSPYSTRRAIEAEIGNVEEHRTRRADPKGAARQADPDATSMSHFDRAYVARLQEIADDLGDRGAGAAQTVGNAGPEAATPGVPPVAAVESPRAGDPRARRGTPPAGEGPAPAGGDGGYEPTVQRIDPEGRVTDTGQTEGELAGIRATQGAMDLTGRGEGRFASKGPESARLPRPGDEPEVLPISGGGGRSVDEMRAEAPAGYRLRVPKDGDPEYRRVLTQADMEWRASHPEAPPYGEQNPFEGAIDAGDIGDTFAYYATAYHPRFNSPTPTLSADYRTIERQARREFEKLHIREALDGMGVDDIKDLEPADRKALYKSARAEAVAFLKEIEGEVLRDEWFEGLKGAKFQGFEESASDFGIPGSPETPPPALPPAPPDKTPPPREPGPGNPQRGFGQEGSEDILGTKPRDELLAAEHDRITKAKGPGRVKGRKREQAPIKIIRDALRTTNRTIEDWVNETVDQLRFDADAAGLQWENRDTHWAIIAPDGTEAPMRDVVEGVTEAGQRVRSQLTPEQADIIRRGQRLLERAVKTAERQGVEVPLIDTETGEFWPSRVRARDVDGRRIERTGAGTGTPGRRTLGGAREGQRTTAAEAIGAETENLVYADPFEALKESLRLKLRMGQDAYVASLMKPLAVKSARSGFGYRPLRTSHPALDRVRYVGETESGAAMLGNERPLFPEKVADELDKILNQASIANTSPGRFVTAINSVLTPIRASSDLSAFLNTGLGFIESSPQNVVKAVRGQIDVVRSTFGDPEKYAQLRRSEINRTRGLLREAGIAGDQADDWLVRHGKHYAGEKSAEEFLYPEGFKGVLREKGRKVGEGAAAVLDWSDENFARYLNYARDTLANDALERAVKKGLRGADLENEMEKALKSVNRMTGWTDTQVTGIERIGMFAPRFFRANIEQIGNAFTKGDLEGSIARRHLLKLMSIAGATTVAINSARGYNTDVDPRSHNFMRIRDVAGRDITLFGPFATIIRAAAQTAAGEAGQASDGQRGRGFVWGTNAPRPDAKAVPDFMRTKASPVMSTLWTLLITQKTFDERPIEADPTKPEFYTGTLPNLARENVPFSAQGFIEEGVEPAIRDRDATKLVTGAAAAGVSGFGVQSSQTTPSERRELARERVAQTIYGRSYRELDGAEKSLVNQAKAVREQEKEVERRGLERDDARTQIEADYKQAIEAAGQYLASGKAPDGRLRYTGVDYRKALDDAGAERAARLKQAGGNVSGELDGWFNLREEARMADGQIDFGKLEKLQAEYQARHPGILDELAKFVGAKDDPTQRRLRVAREQAGEYYQIPPVRGMSLEDGERANAILDEVRIMTTADQASSTKHALSILISAGRITSQEAQMALQAQKLGTNPERQAYRNTHPEFAEFYVGVDASLGATGVFPAASGGGSGRSGLPTLNVGGSRRSRSSSRRSTSARTRRR